MALTDGAARERIAAQDLAALRGAGVLDRGPAPRAAALLRRPVPRRARSDPRSAVLPHARSGPRPGGRQRRRTGSVRAPGDRSPIAGHLAGPRRHSGRRARPPAAPGRRVARQHSRGGAAVGQVRPVASAAAAHAQPHGAVRAGSPARRVHRQSDRRLSHQHHRPAHGRGRRRRRRHGDRPGAVAGRRRGGCARGAARPRRPRRSSSEAASAACRRACCRSR